MSKKTTSAEELSSVFKETWHANEPDSRVINGLRSVFNELGTDELEDLLRVMLNANCTPEELYTRLVEEGYRKIDF